MPKTHMNSKASSWGEIWEWFQHKPAVLGIVRKGILQRSTERDEIEKQFVTNNAGVQVHFDIWDLEISSTFGNWE